MYLHATRLDDGSWRGGRYLVHPLHGCECPDRMYRGAVCKHELRARLDPVGPFILDALRAALAAD